MDIGALSAIGGLRLAVTLDTPVWPTITCISVVLFAFSAIGHELGDVSR